MRLTEKEKAQRGLLYDNNNDPQLVAERQQAKEQCYDYNQLRPSMVKEREDIIRQLFAQTGDTFWIEQPFYCDQGYNITIGDHFYCNHNTVMLDAAPITFGDYVFIAPNCGFYTAGHPLDAEQRNQGLEIAYPIHVGNNVWIGGGVSVLPGVTIGDNSVIGAGSVVTKDIPPGVIAAGNPCRVIRDITEADRDKYPRV
ncbi:sugar O-acetyltransferase [Paenibacillus kandeliae]|uniref:sugar O-acetyltransferase n=1 Tax=Paenibacillus kandeliae TaxID=3231269 RepID=UPI003457E6C0